MVPETSNTQRGDNEGLERKRDILNHLSENYQTLTRKMETVMQSLAGVQEDIAKVHIGQTLLHKVLILEEQGIVVGPNAPLPPQAPAAFIPIYSDGAQDLRREHASGVTSCSNTVSRPLSEHATQVSVRDDDVKVPFNAPSSSRNMRPSNPCEVKLQEKDENECIPLKVQDQKKRMLNPRSSHSDYSTMSTFRPEPKRQDSSRNTAMPQRRYGNKHQFMPIRNAMGIQIHGPRRR